MAKLCRKERISLGCSAVREAIHHPRSGGLPERRPTQERAGHADTAFERCEGQGEDVQLHPSAQPLGISAVPRPGSGELFGKIFSKNASK